MGALPPHAAHFHKRHIELTLSSYLLTCKTVTYRFRDIHS